MPRYYFHIRDGKDQPDLTGVELPDLEAAKIEALKFAGAVIADERPREIWSDHAWSLEVTDSPARGGGRLLLDLRLQARDHTASKF